MINIEKSDKDFSEKELSGRLEDYLLYHIRTFFHGFSLEFECTFKSFFDGIDVYDHFLEDMDRVFSDYFRHVCGAHFGTDHFNDDEELFKEFTPNHNSLQNIHATYIWYVKECAKFLADEVNTLIEEEEKCDVVRFWHTGHGYQIQFELEISGKSISFTTDVDNSKPIIISDNDDRYTVSSDRITKIDQEYDYVHVLKEDD